MNTSRVCLAVATLGASLAALSTEGVARADGPDGVRFRGGIQLEGGVLAPPDLALGAIGPQGQLGVQINNLIGVYAVPGFNILFGKAGGLDLDFAIMADATLLDDRLMVGGGLDTGAFVAFGGSANTSTGEASAAVAGGGVYGLRLHSAYNLIVNRSATHARRTALFVGLDVRLLSGPVASGSSSCGAGGTDCTSGSSVSDHGFVFGMGAMIGYQAF